MESIAKKRVFQYEMYKNCLYDLILALLDYWDVDIEYYISNNYFAFIHSNARPLGIQLENRFFLPEIDVLEYCGVHLQFYRPHISVKSLLTNLNDQNLVVLVPIDRFFWKNKNNKKFYNLRHYPHYLLLTSYDEETDKYIMYESAPVTGIQKGEVGIGELDVCYNGYMNFLFERDVMVFSKITQEEQKYSFRDSIRIFRTNYLQKREEIVDSFFVLSESAKDILDLYRFFLSIKRFDTFEIAESFFSIEKYFAVQQKIIMHLFGSEKGRVNEYQEIINRFVNIKNVCIKYSITKTDLPSIAYFISDNLFQIYRLNMEAEAKLFKIVNFLP